MSISQNDEAALGALLAKLAPDQLSSIEGSLSEPGSLIGAAKDSAKYEFLLKLVELNLAVEVPLPDEIDSAVRASVTAFSINEEAKPAVGRILLRS